MKIHLPPSITANSSWVINSLPQCQVMNSKTDKKFPSFLLRRGIQHYLRVKRKYFYTVENIETYKILRKDIGLYC